MTVPGYICVLQLLGYVKHRKPMLTTLPSFFPTVGTIKLGVAYFISAEVNENQVNFLIYKMYKKTTI